MYVNLEALFMFVNLFVLLIFVNLSLSTIGNMLLCFFIFLFINRIIYRMVLLNTLVFMETPNGSIINNRTILYMILFINFYMTYLIFSKFFKCTFVILISIYIYIYILGIDFLNIFF